MPGIANRTVPRLRAQPGSLLSLLPVRNVKDQPVGGSRREQTHTYTYHRVHNPLCAHTHARAQRDKTHARTLRHTPTLRRRDTLEPGELRSHIMRAPARPRHEASAEMIQDPPLGARSVGQVERAPERSRTATLLRGR